MWKKAEEEQKNIFVPVDCVQIKLLSLNPLMPIRSICTEEASDTLEPEKECFVDQQTAPGSTTKGYGQKLKFFNIDLT